jgi:HSP20 family protein
MLMKSWMRPGTLPMDVYRSNGNLVIEFDVPGLDAESIEVNVEDKTLKVVSARPRPTTEGIQWLTAERPHGTSRCELYLGDGLDVDALVATCDNGVLTVTIPVIEPTSRRIEITRGEQPAEGIEAPAASAA